MGLIPLVWIKYPRKFYPGRKILGIKYTVTLNKISRVRIKYPRKFYPGGIEYTIQLDKNLGDKIYAATKQLTTREPPV